LARQLLVLLRDDGAMPRPPSALAEVAASTVREVERGLAELVADGAAVRVRRDVVYPTSEYRRLREAVVDQAHRDGSVGITSIRDALRISRKYAQALLEHLGSERVLERTGDLHYPRGPVRS
jgi:selenocysteine-specific elongation factor